MIDYLFAGYGESQQTRLKDVEPVDFLREVISVFGLRQPVIVSPSMSGKYAVPYLAKYWQDMTAYIPVAPVGVEVLDDDQAMKIPVSFKCFSIEFEP